MNKNNFLNLCKIMILLLVVFSFPASKVYSGVVYDPATGTQFLYPEVRVESCTVDRTTINLGESLTISGTFSWYATDKSPRMFFLDRKNSDQIIATKAAYPPDLGKGRNYGSFGYTFTPPESGSRTMFCGIDVTNFNNESAISMSNPFDIQVNAPANIGTVKVNANMSMAWKIDGPPNMCSSSCTGLNSTQSVNASSNPEFVITPTWPYAHSGTINTNGTAMNDPLRKFVHRLVGTATASSCASNNICTLTPNGTINWNLTASSNPTYSCTIRVHGSLNGDSTVATNMQYNVVGAESRYNEYDNNPGFQYKEYVLKSDPSGTTYTFQVQTNNPVINGNQTTNNSSTLQQQTCFPNTLINFHMDYVTSGNTNQNPAKSETR